MQFMLRIKLSQNFSKWREKLKSFAQFFTFNQTSGERLFIKASRAKKNNFREMFGTFKKSSLKVCENWREKVLQFRFDWTHHSSKFAIEIFKSFPLKYSMISMIELSSIKSFPFSNKALHRHLHYMTSPTNYRHIIECEKGNFHKLLIRLITITFIVITGGVRWDVSIKCRVIVRLEFLHRSASVHMKAHLWNALRSERTLPIKVLDY